jgi:hypothetical protein
MDSTTMFPITFDRPSRIPMTVLGVGPKVSGVKVSPSTVDIRLGWAFKPRSLARASHLSGH